MTVKRALRLLQLESYVSDYSHINCRENVRI